MQSNKNFSDREVEAAAQAYASDEMTAEEWEWVKTQPEVSAPYLDGMRAALEAAARVRGESREIAPASQEERDALGLALQGVGLTDDPTQFGDGIHSWRCEHPDRYGRCDCFDEAVTYILNAGFRLGI